MKRIHLAVLLGVLAGVLALQFAPSDLYAQKPRIVRKLQAILTGYDRVPPISTTGSGKFSGLIRPDESGIEFTFSYADLQAPPTEVHIHFGQEGVNGGSMAHLCGHDEPCPTTTSGTIEGHISAHHIEGPVNQGIGPEELEEALKAMRAGMTYVNVATEQFLGGEIRGQIQGVQRKHGHFNDDDR
jgi:hypothetical protein